MGKYSPLKSFLLQNGGDHLAMTFSLIEKVLNLQLPASKQYPAWWSNNPSNNPMTQEWLDAGFETESVDIPGEKLVFRRVRDPISPAPNVPSAPIATGKSGFGFMKGLLTIEDGYDVTKPLGEDWERGYLGLEENK
jgi:hypothetical protein